MRLIGLGAVGRPQPRVTFAATGKQPRMCEVCGERATPKGMTHCRRCLAVESEPRDPAPCSARYFAWHPLAGWGSRAVQIAPWVVASVGAPVVAL